MKLSARNKLPATVQAITEGAAIPNVELDCIGQLTLLRVAVVHAPANQ